MFLVGFYIIHNRKSFWSRFFTRFARKTLKENNGYIKVVFILKKKTHLKALEQKQNFLVFLFLYKKNCLKYLRKEIKNILLLLITVSQYFLIK